MSDRSTLRFYKLPLIFYKRKASGGKESGEMTHEMSVRGGLRLLVPLLMKGDFLIEGIEEKKTV